LIIGDAELSGNLGILDDHEIAALSSWLASLAAYVGVTVVTAETATELSEETVEFFHLRACRGDRDGGHSEVLHIILFFKLIYNIKYQLCLFIYFLF